jgi:hypothetical protein
MGILGAGKMPIYEEAESKPLNNHQASGLASEAVRPSPSEAERCMHH